MKKIVIVFSNSRAAIKTDNFCSSKGLKYEVIATPQDISSECGMSLMIYEEIPDELALFLETEKIKYQINIIK